MRRNALVLTALVMCAPALPGQSVPLPAAPPQVDSYNPRYKSPTGRQLVVVYIGMTGCGASRDPELKQAIRRMKPLLAHQADSLKRPLSVNGISLDWVVDSGFVYLQSLGTWDEITVGNNWGNLGAIRYIWREVGGKPVIPQVLVYERSVTQDKKGITFGSERRLAMYEGVPEIIEWVRRGAPIPPKAETTAPKRRAPTG